MAADQFVIVPRPPVRAFALAAVLALAGAAVVLIPSEGALRTALVLIAVVLLACAVLLIGLAVLAPRRQRVTVHLDEAGYRVESAAGVREGAWQDVTRVTRAPGRITLHHGPGERVHLIVPEGQLPQFEAIARSISQHLDDDRGYQVWQG